MILLFLKRFLNLGQHECEYLLQAAMATWFLEHPLSAVFKFSGERLGKGNQTECCNFVKVAALKPWLFNQTAQKDDGFGGMFTKVTTHKVIKFKTNSPNSIIISQKVDVGD